MHMYKENMQQNNNTVYKYKYYKQQGLYWQNNENYSARI